MKVLNGTQYQSEKNKLNEILQRKEEIYQAGLFNWNIFEFTQGCRFNGPFTSEKIKNVFESEINNDFSLLSGLTLS